MTAIEPRLYGLGPVEPAKGALRRAGVGWGDQVAVELNETFAAQVLACLAAWPDLDPSIVSPNGGPSRSAHTIGCSRRRPADAGWVLSQPM